MPPRGERPKPPRPDLPPPASLLATGWVSAVARACQRLRLSPAQVDATMTTWDVLREVDLAWYLYDLDVDDPPVVRAGGGAGVGTAAADHDGGADDWEESEGEDDRPLSAFAARPAATAKK